MAHTISLFKKLSTQAFLSGHGGVFLVKELYCVVLEGAVAPIKEPKVMRMTAALRDQNSRGQLTEAAGPRSSAPGDRATEPRAVKVLTLSPPPSQALSCLDMRWQVDTHNSRFLGEHIGIQRC